MAKVYQGYGRAMDEWRQDLHHVAMRLRAAEEGTPDLEPLIVIRQRGKTEAASSKR